MTFSHLLRILMRYWVLLALGLAVGLAGGAAMTILATPSYTATSQMFVQYSQPGADAQDLNQASDFAQARVKSYVDLVTSPAVLNQVSDELKLDDSASELSRRISVENPLDTVLLTVTVTDPNAERAAAIANAVATTFPKYVQKIETPSGRTTSPVKITATETAEPAADPSSPNRGLNLILGGILGLGLAVAVSLGREQLNTTVRDLDDVEQATSWPPLGSIPTDRHFRGAPLVPATERSGRAEAFRQLRTYLQFRQSRTSSVLMVTSALPDEGRTIVAINLAASLARSGSRVVLVDANLRSPGVAQALRLHTRDGLTSVLTGAVEAKDVWLTVPGDENLRVLTSGPPVPNPSESLGSRAMHDLLESLAANADFVILDAPPLLPVSDGMALSVVTDTALVVVRRGETRREDVVQVAQALESMEVNVFGVVLNGAAKATGSAYGSGDEGPEAAPVRPFVPPST